MSSCANAVENPEAEGVCDKFMGKVDK